MSLHKKNINIDFKDIFHVMDLPDNIEKSITKENITKPKKTILNKRLKEIKKKFLETDITLLDILDMDNITIYERKKLIKLYCEKDNCMEIKDFFKIKKKLKKKFYFYKYKTQNELKNLRLKNLIKKKFLSNSHSKNNIDEILKLNISEENKAFIIRRLNELDKDESEQKIKKWINYVLSIPYNNFINIFNNQTLKRIDILNKVKNNLNQKIYGLNDVKEKILLLLNNKINNIENKQTNITLVGPPGIGKTSIIKILAESLNIPFKLITMGGISDNSYLLGHSYTYVGSKPGKIIESLIDMKYMDGIILFDEIDKISQTKKEVSNQLIHITDYTQNNNFSDYYIEMPIDLSKIWFFFSLNDETLVDNVLKNRLDKIIITGYTKKDKFEILKKFMIPELKIKYSINFDFDDDIIHYIIEKTLEEPGMREIERNINDIFKKLKFINDIEFNKDFDVSFNYLNKTDIKENKINKKIIDFFIKKEEKPEYLYKMFL